ncbi:AI-2E family transporter [Thermococcus pacificus]|uniref:AI-2E family transporter n=1 Tax=Thermococcus pacificus TaxID=71998 RepID=A0A218P7T2_9EURY|nr:AI-2E family transporter [Thermococcus pacificus]ASJ06834.1 AI-2E family transporter [Thermococcus pacificus]
MEIEAAVWVAISLVVLYLVWETVSPILSPLIIAATLAYILYPFHERLSKRFGNRLSALTMTGVLTILTLLFIIGYALWINDVKHSLAHYIEVFFQWLLGFHLPQAMYELVQRLAEDIPRRLEEYVLGYTYSLPKLTLQAIVMVFTFYGLLVNTRAIREEVYALLPMENRELAAKLLGSAGRTLHNLLRGWLAVSVLKGSAIALGFYLFSVSSAGGAIAAGIFTMVFELLPVLGGWMIWLAGAVYLFNSGSLLAALMLSAYGFVLVSPMPDYFLRSKLGKRETGVNSLISLVGIFGGYIAFGFVGIIIGPVALSLLGTLLDEWKKTKEARSRAGTSS